MHLLENFLGSKKEIKPQLSLQQKKERFRNLIAYSAINKFLRGKGIHTPKTISQHFSEGIMEIEDFGDNTLFHSIRKSKNIFPYYKKSVNVILKLQKIKPINKIKIKSNRNLKFDNYNLKNLHKESDLFLNWYLPGVLGKKENLKNLKKNKNRIK